MAKFKVIVSDPETGKSSAYEVEGSRALPLIGRKIGETVDGSIIGLSGYKALITGGSDKDGFPMRADVHGGVKARVLLSGGTGFKPRERGERERKMVRGDTITEDIVQINTKIVEKPKKAKEARESEADMPVKAVETD
ncbi:MAG: 30S ribosomal protein S6e [Nitrososphaerota archaeon]